MIEKLLKISSEIDEIVPKYFDILEDENEIRKLEFGVENSNKLIGSINEIKNQNRLLQIGIVGRVKAGKSSLLNALVFEGKDVLPKAATPMTAALTTLSYDKEISVEIELFNDNDIKMIGESHKKYINKFEELKNKEISELKERKEKKNQELNSEDIKEINIRAEKKAKKELSSKLELSAGFEQYEKMKKSGLNLIKTEEKIKLVPSKNMLELKELLLDYVGANGKYMPFTKSVNLKLPLDNLKGIKIIDTPGLNDPVISREERTRELLKYCDVIFIVSPSGQFLSSEDIDLLDRITTKEGVRELYVLSSQIDNQLYGSIKDEANGDLIKGLENITEILGNQLVGTLSKLIETNPEVENVFRNLIKQGKESIIYSSGICHTIKSTFHNKNDWDEGIECVWNNLKENYPDYFSEKDEETTLANLNLLGNMDKVKEIIDKVRDKKEEILSKRLEEFISTKQIMLNKYIECLIDYSTKEKNILENTNIEQLKKQINNIESVKNKGSMALQNSYLECVDNYDIKIHTELLNALNMYFEDTRKNIDKTEGNETESYTVEKSGGLNWLARKLWGGGTETKTRDITTVMSGAVIVHLNDLKNNIESEIKSKQKSFNIEWKEKSQNSIIVKLRKQLDDKDINEYQLQNSLNYIFRKLQEINLKLEDINLKSTGKLSGNDAVNFLEKVRDYLSSAKTNMIKEVESIIDEQIKTFKNYNITSEFFKDYENKLKKLNEELNTKEISIEKYNRLIKSLTKIKAN